MTIREWVQSRTPPVPEAFGAYLVAEEAPSANGFLAAARTALEQSMSGEARDRSRAFALLAADAYLTYGCAVVLERGGGAADLEELAQGLIEGFT